MVVYVTSCGVVRRTWEKCRDTVQLLRALRISVDVRDLNMNPRFADELIDRMELGDVRCLLFLSCFVCKRSPVFALFRLIVNSSTTPFLWSTSTDDTSG